jgi:RNA polymerase sigma-70 factor (ECF subfamily)
MARDDARPAVAWDDIYARLRPNLVRALAVSSGSYDGVEDAIQDAFTDAMAKAPADVRSIEAWLYTAALNRLRRHHWRAGLARRLGLMPGPQANDLDQALLRADLTRALLSLSARDRELLVAKHYVGMTQDQIAAQLNVPRGTVAAALSRAAARLRDLEGSR